MHIKELAARPRIIKPQDQNAARKGVRRNNAYKEDGHDATGRSVSTRRYHADAIGA